MNKNNLAIEREKQRKIEYKLKLQSINQERTLQAEKTAELERLERKKMADYIEQLKQENVQMEEKEKKKQRDFFLTNQQNAKLNLEKVDKLKEDQKK
jgi:hypothetical protein